MKLRRFWFTFKDPPPYCNLNLGCGVTAFNYEDAIQLMQERVFAGKKPLSVASFIEDVDVRTLEEKHVRPNMGIPVVRGVWFPWVQEPLE